MKYKDDALKSRFSVFFFLRVISDGFFREADRFWLMTGKKWKQEKRRCTKLPLESNIMTRKLKNLMYHWYTSSQLLWFVSIRTILPKYAQNVCFYKISISAFRKFWIWHQNLGIIWQNISCPYSQYCLKFTGQILCFVYITMPGFRYIFVSYYFYSKKRLHMNSGIVIYKCKSHYSTCEYTLL